MGQQRAIDFNRAAKVLIDFGVEVDVQPPADDVTRTTGEDLVSVFVLPPSTAEPLAVLVAVTLAVPATTKEVGSLTAAVPGSSVGTLVSFEPAFDLPGVGENLREHYAPRTPMRRSSPWRSTARR